MKKALKKSFRVMIKSPIKSNFIPLLLTLVAFSFPGISSSYYSETYPITTKSISAPTAFEIICNDTIYIREVYQRVSSQTAGTVIQVNIDSVTANATTNGTSDLLHFVFPTTIQCNSDEILPALITVISGDTDYRIYRTPNQMNLSTVVDVPYQNQIVYAQFDSGDVDYSSYKYSLGIVYDIPHIISTGGSSEIDMSTTTVAIESFSSMFLFYSLIMIVISSIGLIFIIRKR